MPRALDYKTKLIWTKDKQYIIPFYKYNNGIGYIPADIMIHHRNKIYTTANLMTMIVECHKNHKHLVFNYTIDYWSENLKSKFISLSRELHKGIPHANVITNRTFF